MDIDTSLDQVGPYQLTLLDTAWTAVDNDPTSSEMSHHTGNYFLLNVADCVQNISGTQDINSTTLNGCDINASHTNTFNNFVYNDYDVTFHPYKFLVTTTVNLGIDNTPVAGLTPFIYMADIAQDLNMSVQLNTLVNARGYNDSSLSNFVTACYAKAVDFNITKSTMLNDSLEYKYIFQDKNATAGVISAHDINTTLTQGNDVSNILFTSAILFFKKI
jgi:hypothetical protein